MPRNSAIHFFIAARLEFQSAAVNWRNSVEIPARDNVNTRTNQRSSARNAQGSSLVGVPQSSLFGARWYRALCKKTCKRLCALRIQERQQLAGTGNTEGVVINSLQPTKSFESAECNAPCFCEQARVPISALRASHHAARQSLRVNRVSCSRKVCDARTDDCSSASSRAWGNRARSSRPQK